MKGRCYCGDVQYEVTGSPIAKGQCHCRECQYITGGAANNFLMVKEAQFAFTQGTPKTFARSDLDDPRIRHFCPNCGTHLTTRPQDGSWVVVKVGTLEDPATDYGAPDFAIFMKDAQPFHRVPEGIPCFEDRPPRK